MEGPSPLRTLNEWADIWNNNDTAWHLDHVNKYVSDSCFCLWLLIVGSGEIFR